MFELPSHTRTYLYRDGALVPAAVTPQIAEIFAVCRSRPDEVAALFWNDFYRLIRAVRPDPEDPDELYLGAEIVLWANGNDEYLFLHHEPGMEAYLVWFETVADLHKFRAVFVAPLEMAYLAACGGSGPMSEIAGLIDEEYKNWDS